VGGHVVPQLDGFRRAVARTGRASGDLATEVAALDR